MREGAVKKQIILVILYCRLPGLAGIILLFFLGGIAVDELLTLIYIMFPLTLVYLSLILRFAKNHRYLPAGKLLGRSYMSLFAGFLAGVYFLEYSIIFAKAFFAIIDTETLLMMVFFFECIFAVVAGYCLSDVFSYSQDSRKMPAEE